MFVQARGFGAAEIPILEVEWVYLRGIPVKHEYQLQVEVVVVEVVAWA